MPNRHPLNRRLRAARIIAGYDGATEFAIELGYKSRRTVEKLEAGAQRPTAHQLAQWARACNLPIEWFLADFDVLADDSNWPKDALEFLEAVERHILDAVRR